MNEDIIVPLIIFTAPVVALLVFLHYRHKSISIMQETVRKLVDAHQNITPEMIQAIGVKGGAVSANRDPIRDLRRALLFIGFGIATALFGQFIPDADAKDVFTGLSFFPTFIGLGYLAAHYLAKREDIMR